jgi:hypothetical protein
MIRCDYCITGLLGGAQNARYKLIEFLMRAAAECGENDVIRQMIEREIELIKADERLSNLCETVANLLGKPPEG